ncbi:MAG: PleD family two-component system response regulator [Myxococcota bacterium]|nr:response regulator [Myxococcota bacterium]
MMSPQSERTPLVIVAEDDVDARRVISGYLKTLSLRVIEVDDGITALEHIEKEVPQLLILDLNLPSMSGFELCERVREKDATSKVPVLVVTGRNSLEDHARAREVGVTKYISKPFKKKEFVEAVKTLLKR